MDDTPRDIPVKKIDFLFLASINCNSFLVKDGTLYIFPLLNAGVLPGLNLCSYCVCAVIVSVFICVPILLCLGDGVSLDHPPSLVSLLLLPHRSQRKEGLDKDITIPDFSKVSHSLHIAHL